MFTMSRGWEKVFYIGCFITQGSSYISAYTYGLMHRLHHAHTDKKQDPHSPHNDPNPFMMMVATRNYYAGLHVNRVEAEEKYRKNLPQWEAFDKLAHSGISRLCWVFVYGIIYAWLATAWWQWLFFPLTIAMGSVQGMVVNWWAHKFGYQNYALTNTSKNILPFDFIFWGEAYHNNHHRHPAHANNAKRWFEWDMGYQSMRLLHFVKVIKLK